MDKTFTMVKISRESFLPEAVPLSLVSNVRNDTLFLKRKAIWSGIGP